MENKTLGELLPADEAENLCDKVKNLTYDEVHDLYAGSAKDPVADGKLSEAEYKELKNMAITRVNKGISPFPWQKMEFDEKNNPHW